MNASVDGSRVRPDVALLSLALARLALHTATNGQYGFHRDELAVIDDAGFLDTGYVAYPPLTPLVGRLMLELFGATPVGIRFGSALAQSIAMVLAGLMVRELGGSRGAQILAAISAAIAPMALIMGALFQYISFDYLWWVLVAYLMIRLLRTGDARLWLAIGATIGLGMMTKYTMAFLVAGLVAGVLLTPARRYLRSGWLWGGVALSLLIFLPNVLWQLRHDFVSLEFLRHIHERDVAIGRTDGFISQQLYVSANPFTLPLWVAGLYFYFSRRGTPYRPLGWMFVAPFVLFLLARGRFYYLAPAFPMLLAAGSVLFERWLSSKRPRAARRAWVAMGAALLAGFLTAAALMLPLAPVSSPWWNVVASVHDNFAEQIGWEELVGTVAKIYSHIPSQERPQTAILAGNYGEAGAMNLYGPPLGLPNAISGINSYWYRGFGNPPPRTVIVLGYSSESAGRLFSRCEEAAVITNRFNVQNEETRFHPQIFLCRDPRAPWPEVWPRMQRFG